MLYLKEHDTKEGDKEKEALPQALVSINDDVIIHEDEKKFQEYFLVQKEKVGQKKEKEIDKDSELSLNKERIEQHQEMIIEQEESVPAYPTKDPIEMTIKETTRRKRIFRSPNFSKNMMSFQPVTPSSFWGWFKSSEIPVGLKGGKGKQRNLSAFTLIHTLLLPSSGQTLALAEPEARLYNPPTPSPSPVPRPRPRSKCFYCLYLSHFSTD